MMTIGSLAKPSTAKIRAGLSENFRKVSTKAELSMHAVIIQNENGSWDIQTQDQGTFFLRVMIIVAFTAKQVVRVRWQVAPDNG